MNSRWPLTFLRRVFLMGLVFVWGVSAYGQITFSGGPAPLNSNADSDFTDATGPDFF